MNNKRGGAGAKIILVLILMIASAIGGAYGYRVLDGKMAISDAKKEIESIRITDYDAPENTEVQNIIDKMNKDLENASTRKDVYELMQDFNSDVSKVQTKAQKELEAARKEAEEARKQYNNNNNNNNNSNNSNGNNYNEYNDSNGNGNGYNSNGNSSNGSDSSSNDYNSGNNSNDSNGSGGAITNDDGSSGKSGILSNLLGGNNND